MLSVTKNKVPSLFSLLTFLASGEGGTSGCMGRELEELATYHRLAEVNTRLLGELNLL